MTDILKVADDAKMIVNGYAYTPKIDRSGFRKVFCKK